MQKVIIINLNGNAYQLDEDAFLALRAYLDLAAAKLAENPDRIEIVGDLEQAIAEKCRRYQSPHKTVVTLIEIEQVIKEMGPVDEPSGGVGSGPAHAADHEKARAAAAAPKRLYRIEESGMVAGICSGLGAYLDLDPTIVRIVFVLLLIVTKGGWLLVYFVLMFIIPVANTSEERAAAQGLPFTAQELVDQAKQKYSVFRDQALNQQWWKPKRKPQASSDPYLGYGHQLLLGVFVPLFSIVRAALTVVLVLAIISLTKYRGIGEFHLPPGVPVWVGIVILGVVYQGIVAPFRIMRHSWAHGYEPYGHAGAEVWGGLIWLGFVILFFWFAYEHQPMFRDFLQRLPQLEGRWLEQV